MRQPSRVQAAEFVRVVQTEMDVDPRFRWQLVRLEHGVAELALPYDDSFRRAGGTVSGPTIFTLVDVALYAAVCSAIGMQTAAVTTDVTIHFVRRPPPVTLTAVATILKTGRTLVYGEVRIADPDGELLAHATGTYAVAPSGSA